MLNRATLMGRLTRDPELRHTTSDVPVTSFRIAVDRDYTKGDDKKADFFDVTAWRHTAEFITRYFSKGKMIIVDGRLELQEFTTAEGVKQSRVVLIANNAYFGDSNKETSRSDPPAEKQFEDYSQIDEYDDQLPF